jgi:hypothetical protein
MASIYVQAYEAAFVRNSIDECKQLVKDQSGQEFIFLINMILMGATEHQALNANSNNKEERAKIASWAFEQGACLLFTMKQSRENAVVAYSYPKGHLSMLHGPGEVSKGTFHH